MTAGLRDAERAMVNSCKLRRARIGGELRHDSEHDVHCEKRCAASVSVGRD
jgi:hypothetical protein